MVGNARESTIEMYRVRDGATRAPLPVHLGLDLPSKSPISNRKGVPMFRCLIVLVVALAVFVACGGGGKEGGYVSGECQDAIYANVRLSNADEARRFYVYTKLEDWTQAQLAGAIDTGGYLERVEPCRTEVRAEFDSRGYQW